MRTWFGIAILVALLLEVAAPTAAQSTISAPTVDVDWAVAPAVKIALTPNYTTGYGTVKAVFGAQPAASPGPGACLDGCAIDFGSVLAGTDYLYKYAAHLNIQTNDLNGVKIYGEGAADFYNQNDATSQLLSQTLYYLPSTASGDTATGFSASFPFSKTGGNPSSTSYGTAPTIDYSLSGYPATPMATTSSSATADLYYDYQLKVPATATAGAYFVWIVYTVVPK